MKKLQILTFAVAVFAATVLFGGAQNTFAQDSSMQWRGTVDDTVQIRIRRNRADTISISGRPYDDSRYNFDGRAPRDNAQARVEKEEGRGRITVVQQPRRRNNYTTIIEIVDNKGGADRYKFNVYWE